MKCGHTAMFKDAKGNPCCGICDCYEIEERVKSPNYIKLNYSLI